MTPPLYSELRYERLPRNGPQATHWRSYLVMDTPSLRGVKVANATVSVDPSTNRPIVLLELDRDGAQRLANVTSRNISKKLAVIFDGQVESTQILRAASQDGRVSVAMNAADPVEQQEARAHDLVRMLKLPSLRFPLRRVAPQAAQPK